MLFTIPGKIIVIDAIAACKYLIVTKIISPQNNILYTNKQYLHVTSLTNIFLIIQFFLIKTKYDEE